LTLIRYNSYNIPNYKGSILNNKNIIKTSHELNHFRGGYTKLELDFIYSFISMIKDEDEEFKRYTLSLKNLEKKLNKRLLLKDIEYIFDTLIQKTFKVNNEKLLATYAFFTTLEFDKEKKELTVEFNPKLKPHLLKLNIYAKGNLKYILEFKSEYSKRIYMLMSQWKNAKKRLYSVSDLRDILAIPKSFKYNDIKRHVLKKAEKELLEKADIYFTFEEIKEGRKVTDLLFRIYSNSKNYQEEAKNIQQELDQYEDITKQYKNKILYFNGSDHIIHHVSKNKDTDECDVLLIDEYNQSKRYMMPSIQLETAKEKI